MYREATFNNTVGFYTTDEAKGAIITDTVTGAQRLPGDEGDKEAAMARQLDTRFSHLGANANGNDHVKLLGNNTLGFEDMSGLGDKDYNDIVVQFSAVQPEIIK